MSEEAGSPGGVLIVEDDAGIRDTLSMVIRNEGIPVAGAEDGLEALEYLRNHPSPALILLDLMLPRMNGWVFCIELQRDPTLSEIPVVVMSAAVEPGPAAGFLKAVGHIRKPVDLSELLGIVRQYCRG